MMTFKLNGQRVTWFGKKTKLQRGAPKHDGARRYKRKSGKMKNEEKSLAAEEPRSSLPWSPWSRATWSRPSRVETTEPPVESSRMEPTEPRVRPTELRELGRAELPP